MPKATKASKQKLDSSRTEHLKAVRKRISELLAELEECRREETFLSSDTLLVKNDVDVPPDLTHIDAEPSNLPHWILGILNNSESPVSKDIIEAALRQMQVSNSLTLTNAISTATKKLEEKKWIRRSKKGRRAFCKITANGRKAWQKLLDTTDEPSQLEVELVEDNDLDAASQFIVAVMGTSGPMEIGAIAQGVREAGYGVEGKQLALDITHALHNLQELKLVEKTQEEGHFQYSLTDEGQDRCAAL